jgi:DNA-binding beta-propeller fold protein YncE
MGRSPSVWKRAIQFIAGASAERNAFSKPFGLALDESGNLCLTDTGNNTVCYYDLARKQWHRWEAVGKTRFGSPVAIARKQGVFYVADSELGSVFAFDETGRELWTISTPLQRPSGLACAGESLFIVDSLAHAIFMFDLHGQLRLQFGKRGEGPGEFNCPTHIAVDHQQHLLITDSLNSRIQIFDLTGKFISQIGSAGDAPGHFGRPKGIAADTFGHIYVVDAVYDNVQIFDSVGQLLLNWGEGGSNPGQFGMPAGIAIDADNRIYVADSYNRRVQVFKYVGEQ